MGVIMPEKYYFHQSDQTDLNVYRCGIEECKPLYTWGPGIRDHFIVHYVLGGKGSFSDGTGFWKLGKGNGFVIFPGKLVTYTADANEPWTYSWVGFHGLKAESLLSKAGITAESPIFICHDGKLVECLRNMIADARLNTPAELMLLGHLYIFLSLLIQNSNSGPSQDSRSESQEKHVRKVIEFISKNYSGRISIGEIAASINLDRSYLYSIFIKHMNMSPQDFLIRYRMERAAEMMKNPELSIGDIARSVGYEDPLQFSKMFKKTMGASPRQFRSKI